MGRFFSSNRRVAITILYYIYSKVKGVKIATISCNGFWGSFLWEGFSRQREVISSGVEFKFFFAIKVENSQFCFKTM